MKNIIMQIQEVFSAPAFGYRGFHTKPEFNNYFIIHSKYFQNSKNKMYLNGYRRCSLWRTIFAKQWPIPPRLLDFGCFSSEDKGWATRKVMGGGGGGI